ncbi:MAG: hypothetical protein K2M67_04535 [Muribaculaceae bacterium]|nr:hypothetical protein [Muribaculaceae bacterium]
MTNNNPEEQVGDLHVSWSELDDNVPAPLLNNVDNSPLKEQIHRYHQDTEQRLFLANWVVWVSSIWLGTVLIILVMCGFKWIVLDAVVLNVLLATTTANVLGLAYIVLKGLFGHNSTESLDCNGGD